LDCNLRGDSPFFGEHPETLVVVRFNRSGSSAVALEDGARALCRSLTNIYGIRFWLGFGAGFYDDQRNSRRPQHLSEFAFNGDGSDHQWDRAHAAIFLAGSWQDVIPVARSISVRVTELHLRLDRLDIGHRGGTERGHSGFLDGTSNLQELPDDEFSEALFVQEHDDLHHKGGSYLLLRKYLEDVMMWEDLPQGVQEQMVGRRKDTGAFLTDDTHWTPRAWEVTHEAAHVRRANPRGERHKWDERLYRRSFPFLEPGPDGPLAGLLFVALCRDPGRQVVRIHNERLVSPNGKGDLLLSSGYVHPIRTSLFFLPQKLHF
jgi:Dyp-type peroxidase family